MSQARTKSCYSASSSSFITFDGKWIRTQSCWKPEVCVVVQPAVYTGCHAVPAVSLLPWGGYCSAFLLS